MGLSIITFIAKPYFQHEMFLIHVLSVKQEILRKTYDACFPLNRLIEWIVSCY